MRLGRFLSKTDVVEYITNTYKTENYPLDYIMALLGVYNPIPQFLHVYRAYEQTIPNDVTTLIAWEEMLYDTEDMWDPGDPTHINLVAYQSGIYIVTCYVAWSPNPVGSRSLIVGATVGECAGDSRPACGGDRFTKQTVTYYTTITAPVAFRVEVNQNSGDDLVLSVAELYMGRVGHLPP